MQTDLPDDDQPTDALAGVAEKLEQVRAALLMRVIEPAADRRR